MIRIKKINIVSFGGLKNVSFELNDGLNVIYGYNEAGKSTLQAFIKIMLYGISRKKKTDLLGERLRYMPWDGDSMSGSLTVEYEGRDIEIFRKFGKTAAGDKIEVTDCISGENVFGFSSSNVGEKLFNMSMSMFEKTMWIGQGQTVMSGSDEEIAAKLMNLAQTHNEDISHIRAIDELKEKKSLLKAESKRNKNGVIDDIDIRTDELLSLRNQVIEKKNEKLQLEHLKDELIIQQKEKRQSLEKAEKAMQFERDAEKIHKADKLKEYAYSIEEIKNLSDYILFQDCDEAELNEVENFHIKKDGICSQIEKYEELEASVNDDNSIFVLKRQQRNLSIGSYSMIALGIIALIALMVLSTPIVAMSAGIPIIAIGIIIFIISILKKKSYMEKIEKIQIMKSEYDSSLKHLRLQLNEINTRLDSILKRRQVSSALEYKETYNKYAAAKAKLEAFEAAFNGMLDGMEYDKLIAEAEILREKLKDVDLSEYKDINFETVRRQVIDIERQLSDVENKLNYEYSEQVSETDIDNELAALEEKRKKAVLEHKALEVAISAIEEAYSQLRNEFGPDLNKIVNDMVEFLTDGKYSDFRVSDEYRMKINCMGETKEAEYLSCGTYEQIYLALRLGIISLISENSKIAFLDDAFSAYDDLRAKRAIELIKNSFENSQAILLSCHERDRDNAKNLSGVNVIAMNA